MFIVDVIVQCSTMFIVDAIFEVYTM